MDRAWRGGRWCVAAACITSMVLCAAQADAQTAVWTHHNDNQRTGANLGETTLTPANVNVRQFGRLYARPLDGDVYAQPLYLPGVDITGRGIRNVVYVATMNDSVYAFDADSSTGDSAQPLWQVNFTDPARGITTVPSTDVGKPGAGNLRQPGKIGITGTPVIDTATGTLYLVARTKENGAYFQRLHALDVRSGAEKFGGPVALQATVGSAIFDPRLHNQRPGLALDRNTIYIGWGSHDDVGAYRGWLLAYDATTLQQTGAFTSTPGGSMGGIWQSGQPPAIDAGGNVYLMTGNGTYTLPAGGQDASQSFVKLRARDLALLDWFTQCDVDRWNAMDFDLNSSGVVLLPGTQRLIGGGKEGRLFLLDTANLGKVQQYGVTNCTNPQITQSFLASPSGHIHGSPIFYASPTQGSLIYVMPEADFLKAFAFDGTTFNPTPLTRSTFRAPTGMPGGFLSLSANGSNAGSAIVWAALPFNANAEQATAAGVVRAFDASNLAVELWNSRLDPIRDDVGNYAKFVPPTIANGRVYAATFSGELVVYGPNPPPAEQRIVFVQTASATPAAATASVAVVYPSAQIAGDTNVVVVGWKDATSVVQSVTDSAGNAYTLAVGPTRGTGLTQAIYYAKNIVGGANGVTVTLNAAAPSLDVRILEYHGLDTVAPLDGTAEASGSGARSSAGPLTPGSANTLLFAAGTVATQIDRPASPYVARVITSTNKNIAQDAIVKEAASYDAAAVLSAAGDWVMQMAVFKAQPPAPPPPPPPGPPSIASVAPPSGPVAGGTAVTVRGAGFVAGATISFGGTAATNVVVVDAATITATTPAGNAGAVAVVVTNPDAQQGTLANAFTYDTPAPVSNPPPPDSGGGGALAPPVLLVLLGLWLAARRARVSGLQRISSWLRFSTSLSASSPAADFKRRPLTRKS